MSKIGLVVEGGGMKCAYSAGVLDAFLDQGVTFDYCIGVSAGSANASSFLAGQRGRNKRFYTDHIKEPGYFGIKSFLKTGDIFGLSYIYGDLSNSDGADPLDFPAVMANPADFQIVATDALTGKPTYFNKAEMEQDNYVQIMASSALPAVCKPVNVNGRYYYDGGVSDSIPVQHALDMGCDKVVVILSKTRDFVKKPEGMKPLYTFLCRKYPKTIQAINQRHIMYEKCQKLTYELEKEGKVFVFAPSKSLKMGTYSMDKEVQEQLYQLGLQDFQNQKQDFRHFMEK